MSREVGRALNQPDVRARLAALGVEAAPSTPEEFTAFMQKEAVNYARIIKATGAKGE
jgi:tripartite-type tricarboxylate transporter receptor subunit TctC